MTPLNQLLPGKGFVCPAFFQVICSAPFISGCAQWPCSLQRRVRAATDCATMDNTGVYFAKESLSAHVRLRTMASSLLSGSTVK